MFNEDLVVYSKTGVRDIQTFELNPGKTAWINPYSLKGVHPFQPAGFYPTTDTMVMGDGIVVFSCAYNSYAYILVWDKSTGGTWVPANTGHISDNYSVHYAYVNQITLLEDNTMFLTSETPIHQIDDEPVSTTQVLTRNETTPEIWDDFILETANPGGSYPDNYYTTKATKDHIITAWKYNRGGIWRPNEEPYYNGICHYKIVNNDSPGSRGGSPSVQRVSTVIDNTKIEMTYEYAHPTGIQEGNTKVDWYVSDDFIGYGPKTLIPNESTTTIRTSKVEGKVLHPEVIIKDINYNESDPILNKVQTEYLSKLPKLAVNNDNAAWGKGYVNSAAIKLTILSGAWGNKGPGIYYLQAEDFDQGYATNYGWTSWYLSSFSGISNSSISMTGWSSSARVAFRANGSSLSSSNSSVINGVTDSLFKTYTVGGCTFSIEKAGGWVKY